MRLNIEQNATEAGFDSDAPPPRRYVRYALLALLAVIAVTGARPSYHSFKEWRSRDLASQAEASLERGDFSNAVRCAQAAYLMQPFQPAALRAAARVQTALNQRAAFEFWQALAKSDRATADDLRAYVEMGIRLGASEQVRTALQSLVDSAPADPRNLWLLSRLMHEQGRRDEAMEFAREALARDPQNSQYRFAIAADQFASPDAAVQRKAKATLAELLHDSGGIGLEDAVFLAQNDPSRDLLPELLQSLEEHPLSRTSHRLLALRLRLDPEHRSELLQICVNRYRRGSTEDLAVLAGFLNEQHEFARTIEAVTLDRAIAANTLLMPFLDALGGLDRWPEVREILAKPNLPLPAAFVEAFRARTALKLNDAAAAAVAWRRALQEGSGTPAELAFLAEYAEKSGEYEQASRAYRALSTAQADSLPTYLKWSMFLQKHGSTEELGGIVKLMADRWPEEPSFRNDLAYLDLLLGHNIEASTHAAEDLVRSAPDLLPFRTTLALAHLRGGRPVPALESFSGRDWDWTKALPGNRAVYAAALAANGYGDEALKQAQAIPLEQLRPEEKQLIRKP